MNDYLLYAIALVGGVVAGVTNTLAGSGSLITLPVLVMLGLPITIANGTNRIGIVVQNIVALATLKRHGALDLSGIAPLMIAVFVGAFIGALVAVQMDETALNYTVGAIMVAMLFVLVLNPKKWVKAEDRTPNIGVVAGLVFIGIGIYGGFIQAGVGIMLLIGLVMLVGFDPVRANGIKLLLALIFTFAALPVFILNDQVHWGFGALMAFGQAVGAYIAARFVSNADSAAVWIRRALVAVTIVSAIRFLFFA